MDYLIPGVKGSQTQNIFQIFVKMGGLGVILGKVSVNLCAGLSENQPLGHCCSAESVVDLRMAAWLLKIALIFIKLELGFRSSLHKYLFCTMLWHIEMTFNFSCSSSVSWDVKEEEVYSLLPASVILSGSAWCFSWSVVIFANESWN